MSNGRWFIVRSSSSTNVSDARYQVVHSLHNQVVRRPESRKTLPERVRDVVMPELAKAEQLAP